MSEIQHKTVNGNRIQLMDHYDSTVSSELRRVASALPRNDDRVRKIGYGPKGPKLWIEEGKGETARFDYLGPFKINNVFVSSMGTVCVQLTRSSR